jgi:hypothetical protein
MDAQVPQSVGDVVRGLPGDVGGDDVTHRS